MFRSLLALSLLALVVVASANPAPAAAPPTPPSSSSNPHRQTTKSPIYLPANKEVGSFPVPVIPLPSNPCHKACTDAAKACINVRATRTNTSPCQKTNYECLSACARTNGASSAYRAGQKGQLKDNNDRHHAKNGKFQKETAKNKAGRLFDRRTGQLKASPQKAAAAPHTQSAAPATPPQTTSGAPLTPGKRTNGPSSAYRRGQKGQYKDENNRHHAKNGKFQRETARNSNGQLFDRRTGQILPEPTQTAPAVNTNGADVPPTPSA